MVGRNSSSIAPEVEVELKDIAVHDTFAIIPRTGARISPGVRELLGDLEAHLRAVADELDRSR